MKRFALFAGSQYYPCGGWNDFIGDFETVVEALSHDRSGHGWYHVVDLETGELTPP